MKKTKTLKRRRLLRRSPRRPSWLAADVEFHRITSMEVDEEHAQVKVSGWDTPDAVALAYFHGKGAVARADALIAQLRGALRALDLTPTKQPKPKARPCP